MKPPQPVAVIGDTYSLDWIGSGPFEPILRRNNLKTGDKLYGPRVAERLATLERLRGSAHALTPVDKRITMARAFGIEICPHCWHVIDPDTCWCGQGMEHHGYQDGHSGIPMGCTCGYCDAEKRKAKEPECPDYLKDLAEIIDAISEGWQDIHELIRVAKHNLDPGTLIPMKVTENGIAQSETAIKNLKAAGRKLRMWQEGVTEEDLFIPESERP